MNSPSPPPPFDLSRLLYPLLIMTGVLIVYSQTASFDFVNYDDDLYIGGNEHVRDGLTLETIQYAFTSTEIANWHPLTWLSLAFDVSLFGESEPGSMHTMSMLYHLVNSLLLFGLLNYVTRSPFRCFLIAFLFAVHPLHAESVAWISSRKDLLSTLFALLAIWAYFVYAQQPNRKWYGIVMGCFVLSLLSKQMFVTLPFLLLLLDIWPLQRWALFSSATPEEKTAQITPVPFSRLVLEKVPLLALSILFSVIIFLAQQQAGAVQSVDRFPLSIRLQNAVLSYGLYLRRTFWPDDLTVIYPHPGDSINSTHVLISLGVLIAITLLAVIRLRKQPALPVGWFWFLGTLVPVIGIVQLGLEALADRYMYFPQIGLFIALAWLIPAQLLSRKGVALASIAIALGYCVWMTVAGYAQVATWKDSETLMRQALAFTENNWKAHDILSRYLAENNGDMQDVIGHLEKSLELNPNQADSWARYAVINMSEGKMEAALEQLERAEKLEPDNFNVLNNFGNYYLRQNDLDKAIEYYHRAIEADSEWGLLYSNLAAALDKQGKQREAFNAIEQALARKDNLAPPYLADAYNLRGVLFMKANRFDEGLKDFEAAIEVMPDHPQAIQNLNRARQMLSQPMRR
ncbi:MAG: hypothetical protein CMJ46_09650 [Planctomyces sp.]|nr:hypothetical protein [Planctomyces sp.]